MHLARGRLVAPPADGRLLRMRGVSGPKGRTPAGAPPATPPEATSRSGVRHSPRLSGASAFAAAAATTAAAAVSAARDTDEVEVCVGESQPLLSPPARLVAKSCVCDWAQAIQCALPHVEPEPCQRQGCGILVHHLCQGEWERREGYGDTVARLCCLHHPDYEYRSAPEKADAAVAKAQGIISKAKVVNIESQLTTEGVEDLFREDSEEVSEGGGDDDDDDGDNDPGGGGGVGGRDDDGLQLPSYEITDYTANQYDVHERTAHYMERRPISASNRIAVEAVYMVEALTLVKSMRTMRRQEIAERVQEKYKAFIRSIPIDRFSDSAIRSMMQEKYYRAKGTSADGLLTKANDVLKNVRAMAAGVRGVGTPLHQIPSGRSLHDMRNEFILTKWSKAQGTIYAPSNHDDELILDVPNGWWLLNPSTNLLLAVLVHRCNPDVIADPTNVPTGPTRETLRKESRRDTVERRERDKIDELHGTNRQRAEESMLSSKAKLMAQTVDSGTIDQVKEQLSLLSQFKDLYVKVQNRIHGRQQGEDDFDQTAHDLLLELPFLKKRRAGGNESTS